MAEDSNNTTSNGAQTPAQIAAAKAKAAREARLNKGVNEATRGKLDKRISDINVSGRQETVSKLQKSIQAWSNEIRRAQQTNKDPYGNDIGGHLSQYAGGYEQKIRSAQAQIRSHQAQLSKAKELEGYRDAKGGTGISSRLAAEGFAQSGSKVEQEFLKGIKAGEAVVGDGLGRLQEDADVLEALQKYKDISDQGLSRAEVEAEKSQMYKEIDSSGETARRQLQAQLARMGVRGATAGRQVGDVLMRSMSQKADVSRDLFLKSEQMKREGLKEYSSRLGDIKTFDLGQEAAEKNMVLSTGLGLTSIGSSERAAKYAAEQQRLAAQARAGAGGCFLGNTMVKLKDGSEKPIKAIAIGDELETGMVTGVLAFARQEVIYNVNNVFVSGSHCVFSPEGWTTVQELGVPAVVTSDDYVYSLTTTGGTLLLNGTLFADHEGFYDKEKIDNLIVEALNEKTSEILGGENGTDEPVLEREVRSKSN